jgi:hypothetical protein
MPFVCSGRGLSIADSPNEALNRLQHVNFETVPPAIR